MMNLVLRIPDYSKRESPDSLRPDQALGWSTRGVGQMLRLGAAVRHATSVFEFADTLRLPHDLIDPDEATADTAVAYPVIIALLYGSTPPPNLAKRVLRSDSVTTSR